MMATKPGRDERRLPGILGYPMKRGARPPHYRTRRTRHPKEPVFNTYGKPRRPTVTPGVFSVSGYFPIGAMHPRRLAVMWNRGQLSGSPELIAAAIDRASAMRQPLSDPATALALIAALFVPGTI